MDDDPNPSEEFAVGSESTEGVHNEQSANIAAQGLDELDPTQLVSIEPQEYSYFKPDVLSVFNGPDHWLRHKSARTAFASRELTMLDLYFR